jgi:ABC-type branched-subunit amino acid transport system substrate-binding protein
MRRRILAASVAGALLVAGSGLIAGCGNSGGSDSTTETTAGDGSPVTTASGSDLDKNVPVDAPGVTDTEINVAVITAATNILGGHYKELADGIQAYFDTVNADGGIYGRDLKIGKIRDDKMASNQSEVKASLAQDNAFATFVATPIFSGAGDLAAANQPTFIWNINPEFDAKPNMFANIGSICFSCTGQFLPWLAKENGYKKVGILAYGVSPQSKVGAEGAKKSFEQFTPDIEVAFFDPNIQYAQPDLSAQVKAMKDEGVEFVMTYMDQRETLILAKELDKQGLDAAQILPNGYDGSFVADNAQYFEGSFVSPLYVPFEKEGRPAATDDFLAAMDESGKDVYELTTFGWILAHEFVTGLKLAGPEFSQQKVIDSLNQVTSYNADGMIVPIDWTRQHNTSEGAPENAGKWECNSVVKVVDGEFVPQYDEPDKPWICFEGGEAATELDATPVYMSFEGLSLND